MTVLREAVRAIAGRMLDGRPRYADGKGYATDYPGRDKYAGTVETFTIERAANDLLAALDQEDTGGDEPLDMLGLCFCGHQRREHVDGCRGCRVCPDKPGVCLSFQRRPTPPPTSEGAPRSNIERLDALIAEAGMHVTIDPEGVAASFPAGTSEGAGDAALAAWDREQNKPPNPDHDAAHDLAYRTIEALRAALTTARREAADLRRDIMVLQGDARRVVAALTTARREAEHLTKRLAQARADSKTAVAEMLAADEREATARADAARLRGAVEALIAHLDMPGRLIDTHARNTAWGIIEANIRTALASSSGPTVEVKRGG